MEDPRDDLQNLALLLRAHLHGRHGTQGVDVVGGVVRVLHLVAAVHVQVVVVVGLGDSELLLRLGLHSGAQLIEDVEVALLRVLGDDAGLLQQEVGDLSADGLAAQELDFDVFALKLFQF